MPDDQERGTNTMRVPEGKAGAGEDLIKERQESKYVLASSLVLPSEGEKMELFLPFPVVWQDRAVPRATRRWQQRSRLTLDVLLWTACAQRLVAVMNTLQSVRSRRGAAWRSAPLLSC